MCRRTARALLIDNIGADGHIESKTELELVLNIVHWARQCPEEVVLLVLDAVRQSVLLSRETPLGANRPRTSIGAGDVAILRKALHAPAGDGSLLVTRREAELLFTLNDATVAGGNDPEWPISSPRDREPSAQPGEGAGGTTARRRSDGANAGWTSAAASDSCLGSVGKALARATSRCERCSRNSIRPGAAADEKAAEAEARATQGAVRAGNDRFSRGRVARQAHPSGRHDRRERARAARLPEERGQGDRSFAETPVRARETLSRPITLSARLTEYQGNPGLAARPSLREAIPVLTS